jgi:hypothetical protein
MACPAIAPTAPDKTVFIPPCAAAGVKNSDNIDLLRLDLRRVDFLLGVERFAALRFRVTFLFIFILIFN